VKVGIYREAQPKPWPGFYVGWIRGPVVMLRTRTHDYYARFSLVNYKLNYQFHAPRFTQ
jgi:hypothetical protein